jgi:hypothetical protein
MCSSWEEVFFVSRRPWWRSVRPVSARNNAAQINGQVSKVVLTLKEGDWLIELPQAASSRKQDDATGLKWLQTVDPARFISIEHGAPVLR